MELDNNLLLQNFVVETSEGLAYMEQALLELESRPEDPELINTVFRVTHTFKGNAGLLDLGFAQKFAHTLEDLLDAIRERKISLSPEIAGLLFASLDVMREMANAAATKKQAPNPRWSDVESQLEDQLADHHEVEHADNGKNTTSMHAAGAEQPLRAKSQKTLEGEMAKTLRVDIQKLDRLLDLTGEIAIARGRTAGLLKKGGTASAEELAEAHNCEGELQSELQELVLKVRMVPVGPLFRQNVRSVRDIAKSLGKTACLQIVGGDVEVDTSVVEHLRDPLLHMIRNSLDHGIELPAERGKAGKPPVGTITLRATRVGGVICIDVEDDGAGLDRQKILDAAQKRGIVLDSAKLSDQEVYQLIFETGLSTTDRVSNLSGRGVGMEVVCRNVQALRGSVQVTSEPGAGTTVSIRLPLTLAIIEGFSVGVGSETYVVPVAQVVECVELPAEENNTARTEGILQLRNQPLPFIYLRDHFDLPGDRRGRQNIVVVQHEASRAGLAVDFLYGTTQTVIKPLPAVFKATPGVSGSAILGNGRVALILDVPALLRDFRMQEEQVA